MSCRLLNAIPLPVVLLVAVAVPAHVDAQGVAMPPQEVFGRLQRSNKIVILSMGARFADESWPEVENRTAAELRAAGLDVVSVPAQATDREARLAELGSRTAAHGAFAAIRIVTQNGRRQVQVWIHDAITGKMVLRHLPISTDDARGAAEAALDVVELLHASLIEVRMRRRRRPMVRVSKPVARIVHERLDAPPEPRHRFALAVGPALLSSFDGVGTMAGVSLGLTYAPWIGAGGIGRQFSFGLEGFLPLFGSKVKGPNAEATVHAFLARGVVLWQPWRFGWFRPAFGLGLGALFARAEGRANPPLEAETEWGTVALMSARLQLGAQLSPRLALVAAVNASAATPKMGVHVPETETKHLGIPLIDAALSLEWR